MVIDGAELNLRYTGLSDRFRSLWTFYQFLGGVYKHQGRGPLDFKYDFQALYREVQALVPRVAVGVEADPETLRSFEKLERELARIHRELSALEREFSPSLLRKFFDHLKNQDEKILYALVKFYMLEEEPVRDTFDKLDILLTRLAGNGSEEGPERLRDRGELLTGFERLAQMAGIPAPTPGEERTLIDLIRDTRNEVREIPDFQALLDCRVIDRYRELKERLGPVGLHPPLLIEIVETNIALKNRFLALYLEEEARILEDTNRVFEIERYLERNPGVAHEDLQRQLEIFRRSRERFDAKRKENNVKREDIVALKESMRTVLGSFDPHGGSQQPRAAAEAPRPVEEPVSQVVPLRGEAAPVPSPAPVETGSSNDSRKAAGFETAAKPGAQEPSFDHAAQSAVDSGPFGPPEESDRSEEEDVEDLESTEDEIGLLELLPDDPLLATALHKIVFALELVSWDYGLDQASTAKELYHLKLEPWEIGAYRKLLGMRNQVGTLPWELQAFFLNSAALRIKMDEERDEISRLRDSGHADRLNDVLEASAQSLERGKEVDRRFRWFIDDMLFQGDTELLEQVYRSHFRFLNVFSGLWLEHHAAAGHAPL